MKRGNLVAWLAFTTGAVVSIGANVLHALDGAGSVDAGRVVAAGWAPVALLLVVELVARARRSGPWWIITLRWTGTAVVAGVAAIVSYGHMRDLLLSYGETALVAHLLPLSVDGLLLVASLALASPDGTEQRHSRVEEVEEAVEGVEHAEEAPEEVEDDTPLATAVPLPAAHGTVLAADSTRDTVTVPIDSRQHHDGEETDDRAQARNTYRAALADGVALNGKALAARYGRSASWGRTRIRECRAT